MKTLKERLESEFLKNRESSHGDYVIKVRKALEAALSVLPKWQTIDSAPKDRPIQLWHKRYKWISCANYSDSWKTHGGIKQGWRDTRDGTILIANEITHWQELPEGPE